MRLVLSVHAGVVVGIMCVTEEIIEAAAWIFERPTQREVDCMELTCILQICDWSVSLFLLEHFRFFCFIIVWKERCGEALLNWRNPRGLFHIETSSRGQWCQR